MTELSPAAQAVLDAIQATYNVDELIWPCDEQVAAAALRTIADQCVNRTWSVEMDDLYRELYAIAAELEGQ